MSRAFARSASVIAWLLIGLCSFPNLLLSQGISPAPANTPAYSGCTAPTHAGVHVCFPVAEPTIALQSPFLLIATGTGAEESRL